MRAQEGVTWSLNHPDKMDMLYMSRRLLALGERGIAAPPQEWIADGVNTIKFKELKIIVPVIRIVAIVSIEIEK